MIIQHLTITHFRNLVCDITLHPAFNILYGSNGSGKTSFLEAIHFLSTGRSFRTRSIARMINHTSNEFSVFSKIRKGEDLLPVGVKHSRQGEKRIRINGETHDSSIEVARLLPLLVINTDEHRLISAGPENRRRFMNWGMFHVEQDFHPHWQRMQQAVKQRNSALKYHCKKADVEPWTRELLATGGLLDIMRERYLQALTPFFDELVGVLLKGIRLTLVYDRGWRKGESLEDVLDKSFVRDQQLGYTQYGPHRANLLIKTDDLFAKDVLSRGQQKLAIYALRLAQGLLFKELTNRSCVYLIDDLTAELDKQKRKLVIDTLKTLKAQVFVTGVERSELARDFLGKTDAMFHVEHGGINKRQ